MNNGTPLSEGMPVTILESKHADVHVGAKGVIDCVVGEGFGVKIEGNFSGPWGCRAGVRVCYFPRDHLKADHP